MAQVTPTWYEIGSNRSGPPDLLPLGAGRPFDGESHRTPTDVDGQFHEVLFELESFAGPASTTTHGQFHNLDESFDRVNSAYFQGSIPKPNLVWSHARTVRTFGHYQAGRDVVMLSLSLDQPKVPAALVDYLMYHELLHKKHGTMVVNGRRLVHTGAFRDDERRFASYLAARRQLTQLAIDLRGKAQKQSVES